jgi:hypothetical protein
VQLTVRPPELVQPGLPEPPLAQLTVQPPELLERALREARLVAPAVLPPELPGPALPLHVKVPQRAVQPIKLFIPSPGRLG